LSRRLFFLFTFFGLSFFSFHFHKFRPSSFFRFQFTPVYPIDIIATDTEGWVYVADRENHRVQVFDGNGKYETQWVNMYRPCGLYCCRGTKPQFIIGEFGPAMAVNRNHPNIGPRLSIVDGKGKVVAAWRRGGTGSRDREVRRAARTRGRLARRHLRR
jgi:NHL repeat